MPSFLTFDGEFTGLNFGATDPSQGQWPLYFGFVNGDGTTERFFITLPSDFETDSSQWVRAERIHGIELQFMETISRGGYDFVYRTRDGKFKLPQDLDPREREAAVKIPVLDPHQTAERFRDLFGVEEETPPFLVGHSITTDILVINQLMQQCGYAPISVDRAICTKLMANLFHERGTSLGALSEKYPLGMTQGDVHDALSDAQMTQALFGHLTGKILSVCGNLRPAFLQQVFHHHASSASQLDVSTAESLTVPAMIESLFSRLSRCPVTIDIESNTLRVYPDPQMRDKILKAFERFEKGDYVLDRDGQPIPQTGFIVSAGKDHIDLQLSMVPRRFSAIYRAMDDQGCFDPKTRMVRRHEPIA